MKADRWKFNWYSAVTIQLVQHCKNLIGTALWQFHFLSFFWRNSPNQAQAASLLRVPSHTQLHKHTLGRTPLHEWSARRRGRYLYNTQQTNIHSLGGIRTRDPSNRAAADLLLRPHSHRDRLNFNYGCYYYVGYYQQYNSNIAVIATAVELAALCTVWVLWQQPVKLQYFALRSTSPSDVT